MTSPKMLATLHLLQSSNGECILKGLKDLSKLPSISARALKESGIYECVQDLCKRNGTIGQTAVNLLRRWRVLVTAYEESRKHDEIPHSMDNRHMRQFNRRETRQNLSPFLPHSATPDDGSRCFSGDSSRSEEPTFHHGLEPESKSVGRGNKQNSRNHDPLRLESVRSQDSLEGFQLRADSGSSSNGSRGSNADPLDVGQNERSSNIQARQLGNRCKNNEDMARDSRMNGRHQLRADSGGSNDNTCRSRGDHLRVAETNGVASSDDSPGDPNLRIESLPEPIPSTSTGLVGERATFEFMEQGLKQYRAVKLKETKYKINPYRLHCYLKAQQGYGAFWSHFDRLIGNRRAELPPDYIRKAYEFFLNANLAESNNWPSYPPPNHVFDADRDFRVARSQSSRTAQVRPPSGHQSKNPLRETKDELLTRRTSALSTSKQVPRHRLQSKRTDSADVPKSSNFGHNPYLGFGSADSACKKQPTPLHRGDLAHQEQRPPAVEKNAERRKAERSSFAEHSAGSGEPSGKVPKSASSRSAGSQVEQTKSSGDPPRKFPKAECARSSFSAEQGARSGEPLMKHLRHEGSGSQTDHSLGYGDPHRKITKSKSLHPGFNAEQGAEPVEPPRKVPKHLGSRFPAELCVDSSEGLLTNHSVAYGEPLRKTPKNKNSHPGLYSEQGADPVEHPKKVPRPETSRFQAEPCFDFSEQSRKAFFKAGSSRSGHMPEQSFGHKSDAESRTSSVEQILKSVEGSSSHGCGGQPITMLDVVTNSNFELVSPIGSPERVQPSSLSKTKEKRHKQSVKTEHSPIIDPCKLDSTMLNSNFDINRPSASRDAMGSPSLELNKSGAFKGSPSVDHKSANPNGNSGPSTSKGASKDTPKEKKPQKAKKGKLWNQSLKDANAIRRMN